MANIHRINDYRSNDNPTAAPLLGGQPNEVPFLSLISDDVQIPGGNPRKETPFQFCRAGCCPKLSLKSFTAVITILEILIYIITLILTFANDDFRANPYQTDFLPPGSNELKYGNRDNAKIVCNIEIWRFVTPIFLHASFLHIFFNMVSQMIFGPQIEMVLGVGKMILIYFLCGIGANVFGGLVVLNKQPAVLAVGASTSIVGLIGVLLAYIIVNWKRLDSKIQCFLTCTVAFIIIFNLLFFLQENNSRLQNQVDNYGHLGGLMAGVITGMFLIVPKGGPPQPYERKVRIVGIVLSAIYFITCFTLFFTTYKLPCIRS